MSANDVAADQLKCARVLSVILADGTLSVPGTWSIHTYPGYEPPIAPMLEGLFMESLTLPAAADLRARLQVYADRFGLVIEEKPHGGEGRVAIQADGRWQGVDLRIWGPARAEEVVG